MRLIAGRRDDLLPAHVAAIHAQLTDDTEAVMLKCTFANTPFDPPSVDPRNCVAIFFDRSPEEPFDAASTEAGFIEVMQMMNAGSRIVY